MTMLATPLAGCPGDDGGTTAGDATAASTGSVTQDDSASADATADDGASSQASVSGSGSASGTGSSGGDATTTATTNDTTTDTGDPVTCGELQCNPGEICLSPCCGGPAPFCGPVEGAECPPNTHPVVDCQFGKACTPGQTCCEDDPCVPDPPMCIPAGDATCEPSPNSPTIQCSDPCFGTLNNGILMCECA